MEARDGIQEQRLTEPAALRQRVTELEATAQEQVRLPWRRIRERRGNLKTSPY